MIIFHRGDEEFHATVDRSSIPIFFLALSSSSAYIVIGGHHPGPCLTVVDHRSILRNKSVDCCLHLFATRLVRQQKVRLAKQIARDLFCALYSHCGS